MFFFVPFSGRCGVCVCVCVNTRVYARLGCVGVGVHICRCVNTCVGVHICRQVCEHMCGCTFARVPMHVEAQG